MAYNKSKYVEAAQKLLNQGKVPQAIAEYQQILKYEPRDQVTLMTIGELYIRQNETLQAIDYFERLAQLFVSDGFLTKAIAVYKRIAKLAPEEIRPLEKLADLYVQQGVMSEARPIFLQLAELHLKANKQPEAIALLRKLLMAEPDNLRIQVRLADLYHAMGQSGEALETYISGAQRSLARGDQAEAERLADKALKINPKNVPAMIVKARAHVSQGNAAQAVEILEQVPDLEKGGEPAELLLELYLKNGRWDEATAFALRIFSSDEKNFGATQKVTDALLESGQGERAMSLLSRIRLPMIDAGEHETVIRLLNDLATRLPGRLEPLEWLVDSYGRTSDSFRLPDALANLGDALVTGGKLERAKEVFEQLVDREPESDSAKRRLTDVQRKLGLLPPEPEGAIPEPVEETLKTELPKAEAPKVRPDLETAPLQVAAKAQGAYEDAPLDEETQKFISQSLTDVDLFASYGLTQKAIGLLEAILRRAPTHTPTLEKLLDFVLGAGDDRRTAELSALLEKIHGDRGDARSSERFGELRRRFQRAAGLTDEEIDAAVLAALPQPAPQVDAVAVPEATAAAEAVPVEAAPDASLEVSEELAETPAIDLDAVVAEMTQSLQPEAAPMVAPAGEEPTSEAPEIELIEQPAESDVAPVEEVDLSDEWASLLDEARAPAPEAPAPVPVEEASVPAAHADAVPEFDVTEFLLEEPAALPELPAVEAVTPAHAEASPVEGHAQTSEHPEFEITPVPEAVHEDAAPSFADLAAELSGQLGEAEQPGASFEIPESHPEMLPDEIPTALPVPEEAEQAAGTPESALELPVAAVPSAPEPESDLELDQEFELVLEPEPLVSPHEQAAAIPTSQSSEPAEPESKEAAEAPAAEAKTAAGGTFSSEEFLSDLAKEFDELGLGEFSPNFAETPSETPSEVVSEPVASAAPQDSDSSVAEPLKEVFDEFRAELGEMGSEDEDLETHYNLGIAFREMGLLEEAIGEFQKVAKATDRGKAFRYTMQCCTLLGLAFMEKGQGQIAAIWYERALATPGVDAESKLALRYDLGVAQESAGDLDAALKSFSQVYAVNIDYRDVADRISALQKPAR